MASSKKSNQKGSKKGGNVSLGDADRRYLDEARRSAPGGAADTGALFEALERFGLNSERVERLRKSISDIDVRDSVERASEYLAAQIEEARDYARENPKKVIGGAAGVLVGSALLAMAVRRATEASRKGSKKGGAKKSGGSKKTSGSKKSTGAKKSGGAKKSAKKR